MGTDRRPITEAQPRLRCVLDQQEAMLIAPCSPASRVLGQSEIVNEVECSGPRAKERLEIPLLLLQEPSLSGIVESTNHPGPVECFNLRALVVCGYQNLVPRLEAQSFYPHIESVSRNGIDAATGFLQRKGKPTPRRPAHVGLEWQRWHHRDERESSHWLSPRQEYATTRRTTHIALSNWILCIVPTASIRPQAALCGCGF